VDSELIPTKGRVIQCGSCEHVWFFKKNDDEKIILSDEKRKDQQTNLGFKKEKKFIDTQDVSKPSKKALVKYQDKSTYSLGKFIRHIFVFILSFLGLIIFLDTLKVPLSNIFPNLELFLFNLYELVIDITLFIRDLI
tara:strand:- start:431 stop:841 length:411 start_codon:yes stop_codon:yes gene_type:complete